VLKQCVVVLPVVLQDQGRGIICFVNIADYDYDPSKNMGVTYEEAMDTVHAIHRSGEVGENHCRLPL
jgi:hypothetical protein